MGKEVWIAASRSNYSPAVCMSSAQGPNPATASAQGKNPRPRNTDLVLLSTIVWPCSRDFRITASCFLS